MASVQIKLQITGTRNGEDWPAPGTVIDLPDDEAASLIANGLAVEPETAAPVEENATAPQGAVETGDRKPRNRKPTTPADQA